MFRTLSGIFLRMVAFGAFLTFFVALSGIIEGITPFFPGLAVMAISIPLMCAGACLADHIDPINFKHY